MAGMMPQYIVRKYDRKQPWNRPMFYKLYREYYNGRLITDGIFGYSDATVMNEIEARAIVAKHPDATMLRVA